MAATDELKAKFQSLLDEIENLKADNLQLRANNTLLEAQLAAHDADTAAALKEVIDGVDSVLNGIAEERAAVLVSKPTLVPVEAATGDALAAAG